MMVFEQIVQWIDSLSLRQWYIYLASFFGGIVLLLTVIIWWFSSGYAVLQENFAETQQLIQKAKLIIIQREQLQKDILEVKNLFAQDETFIIRDYLDQIEQSIFRGRVTIERGTVAQPPAPTDGISEIIVTDKISGVTTQDIVELLEKISANKRVFVKEFTIDKPKEAPGTINATITFATIEAIRS